MTRAYRSYEVNERLIKALYSEFSQHFSRIRSLLRELKTSMKFIEYFTKFFLRNVRDILQDFANELGIKLESITHLPHLEKILLLSEHFFEKLGIPKEETEGYQGFIKAEFEKLNLNDKSNWEEIFFQLHMKYLFIENLPLTYEYLQSQKLPTNVKNYFVFIDEFIQKEIENTCDKEKDILELLHYLIIIDLWTIFNSFLKELFVEIGLKDPEELLPIIISKISINEILEYILIAKNKDEALELIISDCSEDYGKWYKARGLLRKYAIDFFADDNFIKNQPKEVCTLFDKIDPHLSIEEKLRKLHLYRNAIVHSNCIITEKLKQRSRITFDVPATVELNAKYIEFAFSLVRTIVSYLNTQIKAKFFL